MRNRRNTYRKRRKSRKQRKRTRRQNHKQRGGNWVATNGKAPSYAVGETYAVDGDDIGAARMATYSEHLEDKEAASVSL